MKLKKTIVAASLAGVFCATASAASMAVRFGDQDNQDFAGGSPLGPTGIDGANWNNTSSQDLGAGNYGNGSFAAGTVIDDTGTTVPTAAITWSSPNTYWNGAGTGSDEAKLLVTYLDEGGAGQSSVTVTGHGYAQYDLYVITTGDGGNGSGGTASFLNSGFTVNGVDQGAHDGLGYNGGTLVEAVGGVGGTAGNWIKYTGLTGDLTITSNDAAGRSPLNGFVILEVPEPSSAALLGLGGLALILRRRK